MSDDHKPVPEPGEAHRDDDRIHYYEVDETKVGDADRPEKPPVEDTQRSEAGE